MKTLLAFFSRADENYFGGQYRYVHVGNTEIVMQFIQELIGADSFKIEMQTPYSPVYRECVAQSVQHFKENARPELISFPESIDDYDTIILGYPCYCGSVPMAVLTFLEHFDWSGKRIFPLCTHEGSGMGKSEDAIRAACPGARIEKGLPMFGSAVDGAKPYLEKWLRKRDIH